MIDIRLIDADELIEHVYRDRLDSREKIAQMVKNAPTIEPEQRWIPCSERMPDAERIILISDGCQLMIGYYLGGDRWTVDGCEYYPILEGIAWMPLPKPWKGGTEMEDNT